MRPLTARSGQRDAPAVAPSTWGAGPRPLRLALTFSIIAVLEVVLLYWAVRGLERVVISRTDLVATEPSLRSRAAELGKPVALLMLVVWLGAIVASSFLFPARPVAASLGVLGFGLLAFDAGRCVLSPALWD